MTVAVENALCDIRVDCRDWAEIEPSQLVEACFCAVRARHAGAARPVSVLFTGNDAVAALNVEYRGKNGPTNVLSFPAGAPQGPGEAYLGDIALAYEVARDEAAARGVPLRDHAAHLLVHGILHLIGYDHEEDVAAATMETEEAAILSILGFADPYASAADEEQ